MEYQNAVRKHAIVLGAAALFSVANLAAAAVNGEQQWISNAETALSAGEVMDQRISANGRFIVFTRASAASAAGASGYLWDRTDNSTTMVATPDTVTEFTQPDVDNAGNVVFVTSNALVDADTNAISDVYYTVPASGEYKLLSRMAGPGAVGDGLSQNPRISTDGQYVVFETQAANFSGFNNTNGDMFDVYRVNVQSGEMDLVSRAASALTPPPVPEPVTPGLTGNGASRYPDVSANGRYVAYQSQATDLNRSTDINGAIYDVVVRDMDTVSSSEFAAYFHTPDEAERLQSDQESIRPGISESGDTVIFKTQAALSGEFDQNTEWDVYSASTGPLMGGSSMLLSKTPDGSGFQAVGGEYGNRLEIASTDGPAVWSTINTITPDDLNLVSDIYVAQADAITVDEDPLIDLVSADDQSRTSMATSTGAVLPAVSADGRYVSYITSNDAQASFQDDTNAAADVYIFDRGVSYCDNFLALNQFTIGSGKWYQLALPCAPPLNSTLADIFGDDLPGLPFNPAEGVDNTGVLWAAFTFDPASNAYSALTLDSVLSIGTGFWIRQDTSEDVTLDLPANSWQTASTTKYNAACADTFHGCARVMLSGADTVASPQDPRWNLKGNPFGGTINPNVDDIRVAVTSSTTTNPCKSSTNPADLSPGCDLNDAFTVDLLVPIFFHWNPDTEIYDVLGLTSSPSEFAVSSTQLTPWQGLWIGELNSASDQQVQLFIPED